MDMAFHSAFALGEAAATAESRDGAALRPLGWAELCARLVAGRDFRTGRAGGSAVGLGQASFHGVAAQWLAKLDGAPPAAAASAGEDEAAVNPTPSAAGKWPSCKSVPDAGAACAAAADRSVEFE